MPTLPATLAKRAEQWFGHAVAVSSVERLSASFTRVTMTGDPIRTRRRVLGQELEFRVAPTHFRHYSPARWDPHAGEADVLFFSHGDGPGARWSADLAVGDELALMGPGGSFRWPTQGRALVLGDATAVGAALEAVSTRPEVAWSGVLEVPAADVDPIGQLLLGLDVVAAHARPGAALHGWLESAAERGVVPGEIDHASLVGHAQTLQSLRSRLMALGMTRRSVTTKAYWATGRTGL